MKYTKGYKKAKFRFGVGFYTVVACCLMLVGGSSWFALSKISSSDNTSKPNNNSSEYMDNGSSYIESVPEIPKVEEPLKDAAQSVPKEPYSSTESKIENSKMTFTMPVQGKIIKDYSSDRLQYSATFSDMRLHKGIDIECEKNTAISAVADGTIISVTSDSAYGKVIEIDHKNGITVKYSAVENEAVAEGDTVKMGDIIGNSGTVPSECNDKHHIHIEVFKDGKSVAPLKALGLGF